MNADRAPPHAPVPVAITATEPVEWMWDEASNSSQPGIEPAFIELAGKCSNYYTEPDFKKRRQEIGACARGIRVTCITGSIFTNPTLIELRQEIGQYDWLALPRADDVVLCSRTEQAIECGLLINLGFRCLDFANFDLR
ncbi:hypothetical protein AVEN_46989-1 [Araneus ventricosus]|uniref:Uncharacterized protein n=1 Tax=Araneus ventricosus TaxID=182803 RepID=A0A4Y2IMT1_ARAVE|nr:hypothetical protein AVEN_46989-1 [Araneus ventricosus]